MWYVFHTYGVTWWPPKFRRSSISGICQIYISSGYMASLLCNMLSIYLEYYIQSETWTGIFQEYARYISNKIWYISHTRWLVSQLVLREKMKGKCLCCTATWLLGVIHFMTQQYDFFYHSLHVESNPGLHHDKLPYLPLHQCTMTDNTALVTVYKQQITIEQAC